MREKRTAIVWIRNDFRLHDNLALNEGSKFDELVPVFIWNNEDSSPWKRGGASKWWLHQSLEKFQQSLSSFGSSLILMQGTPEEKLVQIARNIGAETVLWNNSHDPSESSKEKAVKKALTSFGVDSRVFHGNLLCSTEELLKKNRTPYLVYTPFWKNFLNNYTPKKISKPKTFPPLSQNIRNFCCSLNSFKLLPSQKWYKNFHSYWKVGEDEALKKLRSFIKNSLTSYNSTRDMPYLKGTSSLSPHLHFGEVHPQRILSIIAENYGNLDKIRDPNIVQFCKEVVWREFSHHLLQHFPKTPNQPLRETFKNFPWKKNKKLFTAWSKGQTGYPIVDAGMRQLWKSGWMHNRIRMVTASFLVKHLGIPWQDGAKWFWDTLVDADLANNTQGWQWTAGCGADAAPFFRIFNPITQGEKFDPQGKYAALWCPELAKLSPKWIYRPWEAPDIELAKAEIKLGVNYPKPIVNHKEARDKALWNYDWMKKT